MKIDAPWLHWPEVKSLHELFKSAGYELRFIGGCVRDTLLERNVEELDAATTATPEHMLALGKAHGLRVIPTGIDHGTVTILINQKPFEVTTLRCDVTTDGRHAKVAFTHNWQDDALRRDFTINALSVDADGMVYDYTHGINDCKNHHVRFIGDAHARIQEDYLRILRYFRFVALVGNGKWDEEALAACRQLKHGIDKLSGERIANELLKLLAIKNSHTVVNTLLPLLPPCLPFSPLTAQGNGSALLKLAMLIGNVKQVTPVAERLKLSTKQKKKLLLWLAESEKINLQTSEREHKQLRRRISAEDYISVLQLAQAQEKITAQHYEKMAALSHWQPPTFPVTAKDVMAEGYSQGKALGDALKQLENKWEESDYQKTKEELLSFL